MTPKQQGEVIEKIFKIFEIDIGELPAFPPPGSDLVDLALLVARAKLEKRIRDETKPIDKIKKI